LIAGSSEPHQCSITNVQFMHGGPLFHMSFGIWRSACAVSGHADRWSDL